MSAEVLIRAVGDASGMAPVSRSVNELKAELADLKKKFEEAKPGSDDSRAATEGIAKVTAAIKAQYDTLEKEVGAIREKAEAEEKAAEATRKQTEAEKASTDAVKKRFDAIIAARDAAKENARVAAMGNPWATASRTAVAEMQRQAAAVAKENARVAAMGNPWTTASRTAIADANRPKPQPKPEPKPKTQPKEKPEKPDSGSAMGMLQLGQAIEDAQYGLRGVMNNIPGVLMSFGAGAGAVGAFQIGLVALSQGLDLVKSKMAEMADVPPLHVLTFEEEQIRSAEKFVQALDKETDAIKRRNEALREGVESAQRLLDYEKELQAILDAREDAQRVSSGDGVADAFDKERTTIDRIQRDADQRRTERNVAVNAAEEARQNAAGDLGKADAQYKEQQALINGIQQRSAVAGREKDLRSEVATLVRQLKGTIADPIADPKGFFNDLVGMVRGKGPDAEIARQVTIKMDELGRLQSQLKPGALPSLPGFQSTGDAEKDREIQRELLKNEEDKLKELEKRRKEALEAAESAEKEAARTREKAGQEQTLDDMKVEDQVKAAEQARAADVDTAMAGEQRAATRQQQTSTGADLAGQLDALLPMVKDDGLKGRIAEMRAALTDSGGASQADLQALTQFMQQLASAVPDVTAKAAAIGRNSISAILSLQSDLAALEGRMSQLEANASRNP